MKNNSQKFVNYVFLAVFLSAFAGMFLNPGAVRAKAATEYKELFPTDLSETAKSGKYYFKWKRTDDFDSPVYISTKKNSGYKKTPIQRFTSYSNGNRAYYIRDKVLYYYVYSSQKEHKAKKLPATGEYRFSITYGNRLFITKESGDIWKCWTYSYNVKTRRLKLIKSNCELYSRTGKYALGTTEYRSDVSPSPLVLYKITSSGLTKIKKLTSKAWGGSIIDDRVYYFSYSDFLMQNGTVYCCNLDGSGRKKLATITSPEKDEIIFVGNYTDTKCEVSTMKHTYEYTYSTKELRKIK